MSNITLEVWSRGAIHNSFASIGLSNTPLMLYYSYNTPYHAITITYWLQSILIPLEYFYMYSFQKEEIFLKVWLVMMNIFFMRYISISNVGKSGETHYRTAHMISLVCMRVKKFYQIKKQEWGSLMNGTCLKNKTHNDVHRLSYRM